MAVRAIFAEAEGLLGYFPLPQVLEVWRRFAEVLGEFAANCYLSDLHVATDTSGARVRAFRVVLAAFVRGGVYVHFADASDAESALLGAGFSSASVLQAARHVPATGGDGERVQVVNAVV